MQNLKFLIYHSIRRVLNHKSGFTLIEVLVVIGVFTTVGIIVSAILVTSLRGNNKTNTIIDVKEEGNRALFFISQTIRYAKKFNGVNDGINDLKACETSFSTQYNSVTVTAFDDVETTFKCCSSVGTPGTPGYAPATIASLSGTLACPAGSLLDTDNVSIESSSCYFTCTQLGTSDFPAIGIHFSLNQAGSNEIIERTASSAAIPFQTSVTMRNLYK